MLKHPAEPFRIKMVEPISLQSPEKRKQAMTEAGLTFFPFRQKMFLSTC